MLGQNNKIENWCFDFFDNLLTIKDLIQIHRKLLWWNGRGWWHLDVEDKNNICFDGDGGDWK